MAHGDTTIKRIEEKKNVRWNPLGRRCETRPCYSVWNGTSWKRPQYRMTSQFLPGTCLLNDDAKTNQSIEFHLLLLYCAVEKKRKEKVALPVESRCVDSGTEWQSWRRRERTDDRSVLGEYFVVHRCSCGTCWTIVRAIACKRRHGVIVVSEADAIGNAVLPWDCEKKEGTKKKTH